jgi:hypothetical protein
LKEGPREILALFFVLAREEPLGISTTYKVGLGMKKQGLVVLATLNATSMPSFFQ